MPTPGPVPAPGFALVPATPAPSLNNLQNQLTNTHDQQLGEAMRNLRAYLERQGGDIVSATSVGLRAADERNEHRAQTLHGWMTRIETLGNGMSKFVLLYFRVGVLVVIAFSVSVDIQCHFITNVFIYTPNLRLPLLFHPFSHATIVYLWTSLTRRRCNPESAHHDPPAATTTDAVSG